MKFYCCAIFLAACGPYAWGADPARVLYHIDTVAGSARTGDGGPATAAQFSNIHGIAVDRWGNLYLSDTDNHRVRKVSYSGIVSTIAGTGAAGFTGDGGPAVNAQLNFPYGLSLDGAGNLYVADLGNQRVRRIAANGVIATVAGTGRKASSPDGLGPLETSLASPRNVAVDAKGNLYIAEFEGHRVRRLTPDGTLSTIAGTGMPGFNRDGFPAATAQLNFPAGLAFDRAGALYIADCGNNVVRKVFADGIIGTVLGGNMATLLFSPLAVALDEAGTIYVGDSTFRVTAFTADGTWMPYAGNGAPGFSGDGSEASAATLNSVNDLAVDINGSLLIADGVRLRRVDHTAIIRTVAGDGFMGSVGDGEPATSGVLYQPSAVALDSMGNLFIADTGTQRVRQVSFNGKMTTVAGIGIAAHGYAEGTAAAKAPLNFPMGAAVDAAGNVLVADTLNHRIVQITSAGMMRTVAGTGAEGMSADGAPPLLAPLYRPRGVCLDRAGSLYIVDTNNHRVLRLPAGGRLQTVAGNGLLGFAGDGGAARFARLSLPGACALDSYGNLFIADTGNHSIRKVTAGGVITTVAGTGVAGSTGDEGAAVNAHLISPRGVTVDDKGDIFIGDTDNNRIRLVTPDGVIHTIAGTGSAGFAGDGGPGADAVLNGPAGLYIDGAGGLYFADSNNNRIRRLTPDAVTPPPAVILLPEVTVVNAFSLRGGAIAPGEIVSIFGSSLGPDAGVTAAFDSSGALPTAVQGVEVLFDSTAAPLYYVQSGQINVQVPYSVAGSSDMVGVTVRYQGKLPGGTRVRTAPSAPALLTLAINQDGVVNGESQPAMRGAWMTFYGTGEGLTDGVNASGAPAQSPYAHALLPIVLKIAGVNAEILFAGSAPGMVGVLQINARVPGGFVAPGLAQVEFTVGDATAPSTSIWLR